MFALSYRDHMLGYAVQFLVCCRNQWMSGSGSKQSVAASSRLKGRKWQSCVIHIMPANCAELSDHDEQLSGDDDDYSQYHQNN